jgi:hypothetical protein
MVVPFSASSTARLTFEKHSDELSDPSATIHAGSGLRNEQIRRGFALALDGRHR